MREHGNGDLASPGSSETSSPAAVNDKPPIEWTIEIPDEEPTTTRQINSLLRSIATWLGRAATILGAAYTLDPEVDMALAAIEAATWIAEYLPKILSYLDQPKTLQELQNAVDDPRYGYEIHHIVEAQRYSDDPRRNSLGSRIESTLGKTWFVFHIGNMSKSALGIHVPIETLGICRLESIFEGRAGRDSMMSAFGY